AELARMMVGREVLLRVEKPDARAGAPVLALSDLTVQGPDGSKRLDGISFEVRAGEIVGIAGVAGNGQTELIETLAGLHQPGSGEVLFEGNGKAFWSYPTTKALSNVLILFWLITLGDAGFALLTATGERRTLLFQLGTLAVVRVVVQTIATAVLLVALKKRKRWAAPAVLGICLLSLLGTFGSVRLASSSKAAIVVTILNAALLIYALVLAFRLSRELKGEPQKKLRSLHPRHIKELGVAHVPEDRHRRGLLLDFSLAENTILGVHYRKPAVWASIVLNQWGIQRRAEQVIRDFDVRPPNAALPARALSGGNQQKLIIGREFELPPKLLLVSQPTRGVDIGAIEFIHRKIVEMRDAGCAVLLVSAELEEVTALSDRLLVIHKGKIVGEVDPKAVTNEEIGLMMTGGGT
ncbi:MAG: ATP-binding cassette domain-containing protein, partial [Acidobacteriota bacterium]